MNDQNKQGENWKVFAFFLEEHMKEKGMTRYRLAKKTGISESTIKRFFDLNFCLKLDLIMKIANAVDVELELKKTK